MGNSRTIVKDKIKIKDNNITIFSKIMGEWVQGSLKERRREMLGKRRKVSEI